MWKQKLTIKQWEKFLDINIVRFDGFNDPDDGYEKQYLICEFLDKIRKSDVAFRSGTYSRSLKAKQMCNGVPGELIR